MKKRNIRNMDVEWSYSGDRGPEHWHSLCDWFAQGAAFPDQSPIALTNTSTCIQRTLNESISFHYQEEKFSEKEFKNTIHFVPPNTESYLIFQDVRYRLTDIHFHTPSEHLLEDIQYPIEFHLVHMNEAGQNLVVGCLFELVEEENKFSALKELIEISQRTHEFSFNPSLFLPEQKAHFHYTGSLTTPPTKGPIPWFVFQEVQKMDWSLVHLLKAGMLEYNNRPLQNKNSREIYFVE